MIEFNLTWPVVIGLLVSTILPLLVGLVTTRVTNPGTKAVLLAALSAVTGLLSELGNALNTGTVYDLGNGLVFALAAFLVASGIHFGLLKPTGVSEAVQKVGVGRERFNPFKN